LQHHETQSRTLISANGIPWEIGMEHVPSIRELTDGDDSFSGTCGAASPSIAQTSGLQNSYCGLESHHDCSQASSSDVLTALLGEVSKIAQPVRDVGIKAGNVWLALAQSRRDLMREVQTLKTLQQSQVPDCVEMLSSMLRKFSGDVLRSKHMCSAAEAAVAQSTSSAPEVSIECTCNEVVHSQATVCCSNYLQVSKRTCMSNLQARGFMHALRQGIADTSAEQMHVTSSLQVPATDKRITGEDQRIGVHEESLCNVECTQQVALKGEAIQGASSRATPEGLVHNDNVNDLTWQEVCLKLDMPSYEHVFGALVLM
jgi:hypothetical protein